MDEKQYWQQIHNYNEKIHSLTHSYWDQFSDMSNWQFWVVLILLVVPLVVLFYKVDRKRILELFFFGYTVHVLWTYFVLWLSRNNLYTYKYFLTPDLPFSLNITASLLPVGFLLMYQFCTNSNKNLLLHTLVISAIFAFVFASVESYLGFVELKKGLNQFHLFLIDLLIVFIAYWATRFVLKLKNDSNP